MQKIEVQSFTDELANQLKQVSSAATALANSGVEEETIVLLLWHKIGQKNIKKSDIENVLWGLRNLKSTYLKEVK
jgi:hypothetical protein